MKRVLYTTHIAERGGHARLHYLPVGDVTFNTGKRSNILAAVHIAGLEDSGPFYILRGRPSQPPSEEVRR